MTTTLKPDNAGQVRDAVAWAVAEETPLEVLGGASKRAIGRPGNAAHTLDLSALRGITQYEAEELVLLTITPDYESRLKSYALLADAFELTD